MADDFPGPTTRSRIVAAAAELIAEGGAEAATTRAVATAAGVQAPTIYRLFGDKDGLLEAVAEQTMADYVAEKERRVVDTDPVEDLRRGWDAHVTFGLSNPAIFGIMSGARPGQPSRATLAGLKILHERVRRVAAAGRLQVSEERAVDLIHAMGTGTVLILLQHRPEDRDGLSEAAWRTVAATVIGGRLEKTRGTGIVAAAGSLRARLDEAASLTAGERALMNELLDRIASGNS